MRLSSLELARLLGVIDSLRQVLGFDPPEEQFERYAAASASVRDRIEESDFECAFYEGQDLSPDAVVDMALSALDAAIPRQAPDEELVAARLSLPGTMTFDGGLAESRRTTASQCGRW